MLGPVPLPVHHQAVLYRADVQRHLGCGPRLARKLLRVHGFKIGRRLAITVGGLSLLLSKLEGEGRR